MEKTKFINFSWKTGKFDFYNFDEKTNEEFNFDKIHITWLGFQIKGFTKPFGGTSPSRFWWSNIVSSFAEKFIVKDKEWIELMVCEWSEASERIKGTGFEIFLCIDALVDWVECSFRIKGTGARQFYKDFKLNDWIEEAIWYECEVKIEEVNWQYHYFVPKFIKLEKKPIPEKEPELDMADVPF